VCAERRERERERREREKERGPRRLGMFSLNACTS